MPATVNITWNTSQSGVSSGGWVISDNGNGAGTRIRFNLETASNCGGSNSSTQSGTATATIIPGPNYDMTVTLAGVGEAQDPGYEAMTMTIDTPDITGTIYTAAASGGGLGCAVAPVTITQNIPGPYYLPAGTTNILEANFTTRDSLFHTTACFYQIDLSFEAVDPPTNIQFFRANDNSPTTTIVRGQEAAVLTYNTLWNGQTSAFTATIDQGIGNVENYPGCTLDEGSINLIPAPEEDTTYTLTITGSTGSLQSTVQVLVIEPDNEADQMAFGNVINADLDTVYESEVVTITGLQVCQDAYATNGAEISVNGAPYVLTSVENPVTVCANDTVQLRMTSSAQYTTKKTTTFLVGVTDADWSITTKSEGNNIPNNFSFNDVDPAPILSYVESNVVTITGLTGEAGVTPPTNNIDGKFESRVTLGGVWQPWGIGANTINNGEQLQLRLFTSDILGDSRTTSVQVGDGAARPWTVTNVAIADSNPDFFDFPDILDYPASTEATSLPQTITGINVPTNITCENVDTKIIVFNPITGDTTLYNNAATIENNQVVQLRLTSSPDPGGEVSTKVTIGNDAQSELEDTWRVFTTTGGDTTPDPFYFANKDKQPPNTLTTSNTVQVFGITSPSPVSISGGEFRIGKPNQPVGNWVTTGDIENADTLQLRMMTSSQLDTPVSLSITVG